MKNIDKIEYNNLKLNFCYRLTRRIITVSNKVFKTNSLLEIFQVNQREINFSLLSPCICLYVVTVAH